MPDHLHWLLSGHADFSSEVCRFKSISTRFAWQQGLRGTIWQRSFYDHVVRRQEDVVRVAEYIAANPVRSRLVENVDEYPFNLLAISNWKY